MIIGAMFVLILLLFLLIFCVAGIGRMIEIKLDALIAAVKLWGLRQ